jgi:RimJ/RimL family protein N-acetyltransferase
VNPPSAKVPKQIVTERLVLRAINPADAPALDKLIRSSFRELKPWMPWARKIPTLKETRQYCRMAGRHFEQRQEFHLLIVRRSDGEVLGSTGLVRGDWSVPKFEVGYWLATHHTGQGYVTEAVEALVKFAQRRLKVRRLEIRTDARNQRSAQVAKRVGFELEGRLKKDARDNRNRLRDTLVFARTF